MSLTMRGALTNKQAAAELGLSKTTLERWRWLKVGPKYYKVGNRVFYRPEDLQAFLKTRVREPERP